MSRADLVIFSLVLIPGCAGPVRPTSSRESDLTRKVLLELRPQVEAGLKALPEHAFVDCGPVVRRDGKLQLSEPDQVALGGMEWILDGWGHPIVLVRAWQSPGDWCLLSAGPDGAWTINPPESFEESEKGRLDFAFDAPRMSEEEGSWILGDDIGLRESGEFIHQYPFAVPKAEEIVNALRLAIEGNGEAPLKVSEQVATDLLKLSAADNDKIIAFLEKDKASFRIDAEDGFLPNMHMDHQEFSKDHAWPIRIIPTRLGWYVSWDVEQLLAIVDPPPPATFLGHDLNSNGLFFLIQVPDSLGEEGWQRLKSELGRTIAQIPAYKDFSIAVLGKSLRIFPTCGRPAEANKAMKRSAIEFVQEMDAKDAAADASGLKEALGVSHTFANQSTAYPKAIVLVGTGQASKPEQIIAEFSARNTQRIAIHCLGVGVEPGSTEEKFLEQLAVKNYGTYTRVSP